MTKPVCDLGTLLRTLAPALHPGTFAFATVPGADAIVPAGAVATIREDAGLSVVMELDALRAAGLEPAFPCAWITLSVHSDLAAVGLTAAVADALGRAGIACNVVAGARHDHLFVPVDAAERALEVLRALQQAVR
jgi:hypothetical protein